MTLNLTRRAGKGAPLTQADHDGNLDKLEGAIGAYKVTAEQFGILPGTQNAATNGAAMNAAMNALAARGGGELHFRPGHYYVENGTALGSRHAALIVPSRVYIHGHGATIEHTGLQIHWQTIWFRNVRDAGAFDLNLIGNRAGYLAAHGELTSSGTGITREDGVHISNGCRRITVRNVRADEHAVDGFYVGGNTGGPSTHGHWAEDILLENISAGWNGRQGLSLISARGFICRNGYFHDTRGSAERGGHLPGDGIDIEPNTETEWLENILFENIRTENNYAAGIGTYFMFMQGRNVPYVPDDQIKPISIIIRNHTAIGDRWGQRYRTGQSRTIRLRGSVRVDNLQTYNCRTGFKYADVAGLDTVVDGLCILNDSATATDQANDHPVHIGHSVGNALSGTERLTIRGLKVHGTARWPVHVRATSQPFLRDIDVQIAELGPDTCQTARVYLRAAPAVQQNINIRAAEHIALLAPTISAAGDSFRTYDPIRHTPTIRMQIADPYRCANFQIGGPPVSIMNDRGAGEDVTIRALNSSNVQVAGAWFSPGGSLGGGVRLAGRGAWVRLQRVSATEYRILEGMGWSHIT